MQNQRPKSENGRYEQDFLNEPASRLAPQLQHRFFSLRKVRTKKNYTAIDGILNFGPTAFISNHLAAGKREGGNSNKPFMREGNSLCLGRGS